MVRYFGGILLGARRLRDSYSSAAILALEQCKKASLRLLTQLIVSCSYAQFSEVQKVSDKLLLNPASVTNKRDWLYILKEM